MCDETNQILTKAIDGLMYPSERDAPFDLQHWPTNQAKTARDLAKKLSKGRRISPVKEEDFFAILSKTDDAERFAQLGRVFADQLTGRAIFRIGQGDVSVDVYLIGHDRKGEWIALHTVSIET
ncbi:MAG: hypothetical protein IT447_15950 [Phycisphaerales bacterium]|jgi:hypothetical protein|nr:hypothetical protein [Phycisphaerales bacterium]